MFSMVIIKCIFLEIYEPHNLIGGQSLSNFSNTNIIDMILMDTKRIGHGYNLTNHAYLMEYVKE